MISYSDRVQECLTLIYEVLAKTLLKKDREDDLPVQVDEYKLMFLATNSPLLNRQFLRQFELPELLDLVTEKPEAFLSWSDRVLLQEPSDSIVQQFEELLGFKKMVAHDPEN